MEACGLKYFRSLIVRKLHIVTPYGGVWIEIYTSTKKGALRFVTPYGGVWIEISPAVAGG